MLEEDNMKKLNEEVYYLTRDLEKAHIEIRELSYANYKLKKLNIILIISVLLSLIIIIFLLFI